MDNVSAEQSTEALMRQLNDAATKALSILTAARQSAGAAFVDVRRERGLAISLDQLADELLAWQPHTAGGVVAGE